MADKTPGYYYNEYPPNKWAWIHEFHCNGDSTTLCLHERNEGEGRFIPHRKGWNDYLRIATAQEIEWLNQCKAARTYVDYKPNPDDYSLF